MQAFLQPFCRSAANHVYRVLLAYGGLSHTGQLVFGPQKRAGAQWHSGAGVYSTAGSGRRQRAPSTSENWGGGRPSSHVRAARVSAAGVHGATASRAQGGQSEK